MSELADRLSGVGFAAGWSLVKNLPEPLVASAFRAGADAATRRRGPAVVQFARNMRRVLGNSATPAVLSEVVHAGMRSYARYWKETFRLPAMDHDEVYERVVRNTVGLEHIDAAQAAGRGTVVVLPHSGNWDVAGLMVTRRWGNLTTVVERLKPESLYDKFVAYRESLGMEILPLTGGAPPSQVLKERLIAGRVIALVGDRDLSASGVPVTFFGEATRMPAGPAMLAALTGADLCPVDLSFTDDGWRQVIHPPLQLPGTRLVQQVREGTQLLADFFASGISQHPQDWHMVQPLWLADLSPGRIR
ncbi:MAG TPA: phosphatidylinositol mannoside acyltransferase [Nakamurella sp.]|nr:phosphatidylinositol mannoside acyltransferase [Nakamurella sp.]